MLFDSRGIPLTLKEDNLVSQQRLLDLCIPRDSETSNYFDKGSPFDFISKKFEELFKNENIFDEKIEFLLQKNFPQKEVIELI
jgi:hypothetical protein